MQSSSGSFPEKNPTRVRPPLLLRERPLKPSAPRNDELFVQAAPEDSAELTRRCGFRLPVENRKQNLRSEGFLTASAMAGFTSFLCRHARYADGRIIRIGIIQPALQRQTEKREEHQRRLGRSDGVHPLIRVPVFVYVPH